MSSAPTPTEIADALTRQYGTAPERAQALAEKVAGMTSVTIPAGALIGLPPIMPGYAVPLPDEKVHRPRQMNGIERRRAAELEAIKGAGEIQSWAFEAITLKLADDCRYTPDFFVVAADGAMRFEETKGTWRDDARVKIRVAADRFPMFTFIALRARKKKDGGGWATERF